MSLRELLEEKRAAILDRWIALALGSYPADAAKFLRGQRDRFANPVGHAIQSSLTQMLGALISGADTESLRPRLDDILRIRAVQHLGPTRSLGFLFELKDAVRDALGAATSQSAYAGELRELDRWVDALGLLGFEVYLACREQIYEMRLTEVRNRTMDVKEKLLRQRGLWNGPPEEELLLFPDGAPGEPAPLVSLDTDRPGDAYSPDGSAGAERPGSADKTNKPTDE